MRSLILSAAAVAVLGLLATPAAAQCYSSGYANYYPSYSYSRSYSYYPSSYYAPSYAAHCPTPAPVYTPVAAVTFAVPSPPTATIQYGGYGQYATPAVTAQQYVAPGAVNTYQQQPAETRVTVQDVANFQAIFSRGPGGPGVQPQRAADPGGLTPDDIAALKWLAEQVRREQANPPKQQNPPKQ